MMEEKKVVGLLDEEDAAALLYYYTGEVRRITSQPQPEWNKEKDAEVRRLIKKAAYFAGLLDDIEKTKPVPVTVPQKVTPSAITRTVSGA